MDNARKDYILVTEYFHPDTASTGQLMTDLAVGLRDRGLELTVYTGQPNYHSGRNERQPRRTTHEGVPVRRLGAPQVRQTSLARRLFNWLVFTVWMALALATQRNSHRELVFVSNPPFLPLAMWAVCRLKGWEYTYIVYDLYPDVAVASGHLREGGLIYRAWTRIHERVFADARNIVALGPAMQDRITEAAPEAVEPDQVDIIHNWEDPSFIVPLEKEENEFSATHGLVEKFSLVYSGNIGANHELETVVRAAASFDDEPVKFLIIGEGDRKVDMMELAASLNVESDTLEFLPYQDLETLPYSLTSGDVSVVAVREGMNGLCVSSKLYSSLAAGQPVLVIADVESDEARIVKAHEAGIQVQPGDVQGIADAVATWRENPSLVDRQGRNARAAFERHFTKERSIDEYYRLLDQDSIPASGQTDRRRSRSTG